MRTRKARPFTYERLSSHVKENTIHEEALKRKVEPALQKKKRQKKLGFFFTSKAASAKVGRESETGNRYVSGEDVSSQKQERRKKCRHFVVQEKLNLTLQRKELPYNSCFFQLYTGAYLSSSALMPGINYFVVITHPLHQLQVRKRICCRLLDWKDQVDKKKQEGLLVYAKYFSSAVNDEYKKS